MLTRIERNAEIAAGETVRKTAVFVIIINVVSAVLSLSHSFVFLAILLAQSC
jgi:hypothetical protein